MIKLHRIRHTAAFLACLLTALAAPSAEANLAGPPSAHAIWVFSSAAGPANPVTDPVARDALINNSAASKVTRMYLSVYHSPANTSGRLMYDEASIRDLITKAHSKGIAVYAAYGAPDWPSFGCDMNGFPLQRTAEIAAYNTANLSAKFDGVMLDIEPVGTTAADFVALLTQYNCFQQQSVSSMLKLGVAIRFGWKDTVTYGGVTQPFYKHVIDMMRGSDDHIVVMGYRNFAGTADPLSDGIIASDQDQIAYAGLRSKSGMIFAGLETSDPSTTGISAKETFFAGGQSLLNNVAQVVYNHFGFFSGLGGFAVHNYGNSYLAGSSIGWPATNPNFPRFPNSVEELATLPGAPVTVTPAVAVNSATVTVTFPSVGPGSGYTYVSAINPLSAGVLPSNYVLSPGLAFDIATTAPFTGPVTVCFKNLNVVATAFASLRVLHKTAQGFIDETILTGPNAPNAATRSICASVRSFSPFLITNVLNSPGGGDDGQDGQNGPEGQKAGRAEGARKPESKLKQVR